MLHQLNWIERRALQSAVAIASLVPILAGGAGMLLGPRILEARTLIMGDLDSHFRYLSGLLLAIGIGYATTVLHIEARGERFRVLTGCVFVGGIGRLFSLVLFGLPSRSMLGALIMELLVAPGLALWQLRMESLAGSGGCRS